jgi:hypothetical protein
MAAGIGQIRRPGLLDQDLCSEALDGHIAVSDSAWKCPGTVANPPVTQFGVRLR